MRDDTCALTDRIDARPCRQLCQSRSPFFFSKSLFLMVLVLIKRLFQTVYSVVLVVYSHPVDYLPGQIHVIKARIE